ncbi:Uncharacterised protein [Legionella spiritensis]|nr:Uncharacterised protein [Legionella spiritensis]
MVARKEAVSRIAGFMSKYPARMYTNVCHPALGSVHLSFVEAKIEII